MGHVRDLPQKELGVDIEHDFRPDYVVPRAKSKVVTGLRAAAKKAATVFMATDLDREGEAIAWHLCEALGLEAAERPAGGLQRDHQVGHHGGVLQARPHQHGQGPGPGGPPHPGPAGRLQTQPPPLEEGGQGPVGRPRAERGRAAGGGTRARDPGLQDRGILDDRGHACAGPARQATFKAQSCGGQRREVPPRPPASAAAAACGERLRPAAYSVLATRKKSVQEKAPPPFITSELQQDRLDAAGVQHAAGRCPSPSSSTRAWNSGPRVGAR